jgi:hypothetical protein
MDRTCFALPILPGKVTSTRAFQAELRGRRKGEYAASAHRLGITRELWFLQEMPSGSLLLAYVESHDFLGALQRLRTSQDLFDRWFTEQVREMTGVDLNNPASEAFSEPLSSYGVQSRYVPV